MKAATDQAQSGGPHRVLNLLALAGFVIYALAAPHSIAGSWIGISIVILGWLLRTIITRRSGLKRTPFDLPLWLFFAWTVVSSVFSEEPRESLPKLLNVGTFLMFYLTQSLLTRKTAVLLASVMILSAATGVLWSAGELIVGRGVVVSRLSGNSPLREASVQEGDVIWRVNGRRVSSVSEIDQIIRDMAPGTRVHLSVISHGEHIEWPDILVTNDLSKEPSPSGITGGGRAHRFRASGWTRHYETFAEVLQILAQLALGFTLANWVRVKTTDVIGSRRLWISLAALAFIVLAVGIPLTAMRTTLVAFAFGAIVIAWKAAPRPRQRTVVAAVVALVLVVGVIAVWRTRARGALGLSDASASLRVQVARVATRRVLLHPIFGHGMDAMHQHWAEWGFPGTHMLDAHSTPIQIAFDRGLPALGLWLWLMYVFWRTASRAERNARSGSDPAAHGVALGIIGAIAGFLASSLVNYNFGDSEVALLVWWTMGVVVVLNIEGPSSQKANA